MYKLAEQGGENGVPILGKHGRLNDVIDTEVMNESMRFAKYVMANQEFFKLLEKKLA